MRRRAAFVAAEAVVSVTVVAAMAAIALAETLHRQPSPIRRRIPVLF